MARMRELYAFVVDRANERVVASHATCPSPRAYVPDVVQRVQPGMSLPRTPEGFARHAL